jgi:hypothetical protein
MRRPPPGHPVVITEQESRQAILGVQLYLVRRSASVAARRAWQVARCRHLYRPESRTCIFCGSPHPEKVSP